MSPKRLLLIDDDFTVKFLFEALVADIEKPLFYEFKTNGEEAITYLTHCQREETFPDLVVVDLNMPIMDGFEFIEKYQQVFLPLYPQTNVLIMTSSVTGRDRTRARQFAFVKDFITKPLEGEQLALWLED